MEDDGHAVVDVFEFLVGLGGDDGAGAEGCAVEPGPFFPQAGEGEELVVFEGHVVGRFAVGGLAPFVEAVGGDEAAAAFECSAERGFLVDGFTAGVDEFMGDGGVFGPTGDESPLVGIEDALVFLDGDDGDGL